jgi:hypothetical protein
VIQSSSDDNFTSQHDPDLGGLIERLFADVGLPMPPKLYRSGGRSAAIGVIRFHMEGHWLLATSREIGAEEAVRRLRGFITANEGSYAEVCVFWGMHPRTGLELADGVELGPVDALPQSDQRDFFLGTSLSDEERASSEYVTTFPKPRAALVKRTTETPVYFYVEGPRAERPRPEWSYEDKHFHEDLMHVLPVVTRSPVISIAQWHTWDPDTPVVSLGGGMGWNQHRRAAKELDKEPYDEKAVLEMVQGYFALDPVSRNRLRMPCASPCCPGSNQGCLPSESLGARRPRSVYVKDPRRPDLWSMAGPASGTTIATRSIGFSDAAGAHGRARSGAYLPGLLHRTSTPFNRREEEV